MNRYANLFKDLGKLDDDYSIQQEEGAKLYALMVPCRVAIQLLKPVKDKLASERANSLMCRQHSGAKD